MGGNNNRTNSLVGSAKDNNRNVDFRSDLAAYIGFVLKKINGTVNKNTKHEIEVVSWRLLSKLDDNIPNTILNKSSK